MNCIKPQPIKEDTLPDTITPIETKSLSGTIAQIVESIWNRLVQFFQTITCAYQKTETEAPQEETPIIAAQEKIPIVEIIIKVANPETNIPTRTGATDKDPSSENTIIINLRNTSESPRNSSEAFERGSFETTPEKMKTVASTHDIGTRSDKENILAGEPFVC